YHWCVVLVDSIWYIDLVFFFSSRRRHTRSKRDWSSDVCSSDLRCQRARLPGLGSWTGAVDLPPGAVAGRSTRAGRLLPVRPGRRQRPAGGAGPAGGTEPTAARTARLRLAPPTPGPAGADRPRPFPRGPSRRRGG